jgi:hypothetical protein
MLVSLLQGLPLNQPASLAAAKQKSETKAPTFWLQQFAPVPATTKWWFS